MARIEIKAADSETRPQGGFKSKVDACNLKRFPYPKEGPATVTNDPRVLF